MGTDFVIGSKAITITPLKSHTEAIQKILLLTLLKTVRVSVA